MLTCKVSLAEKLGKVESVATSTSQCSWQRLIVLMLLLFSSLSFSRVTLFLHFLILFSKSSNWTLSSLKTNQFLCHFLPFGVSYFMSTFSIFTTAATQIFLMVEEETANFLRFSACLLLFVNAVVLAGTFYFQMVLLFCSSPCIACSTVYGTLT